jgi:hypothetical protein
MVAQDLELNCKSNFYVNPQAHFLIPAFAHFLARIGDRVPERAGDPGFSEVTIAEE